MTLWLYILYLHLILNDMMNAVVVGNSLPILSFAFADMLKEPRHWLRRPIARLTGSCMQLVFPSNSS